MKNVLGFAGFLVLVGSLFRDNFGFVSMESPEAVGVNLGSLIVYALAGFLIYRAAKK